MSEEITAIEPEDWGDDPEVHPLPSATDPPLERHRPAAPPGADKPRLRDLAPAGGGCGLPP